MDNAKQRRFPILFIITAVLFAPAVGAGVLAGRSIPKRTVQVTPSAGSRSDWWTQKERLDLDSCRDRLAVEAAAAAIGSTAGVTGEPLRGDAGGGPATIEELEAERNRCRKIEMVTSAEVCVAAGRQFEALMALPKDGQSCGPKSRAADLVEEDFEHCDVFADPPTAVALNDLTKEQASIVTEAIRVRRTLSEEELLRRLKEFVYTCTEVTPKRPPGLKVPSKRPKGEDKEVEP